MKKTKKPSKRTKFVPARSPKARAKQKAAIRKYYAEKKPKESALSKQGETYPHFRYYKKSGHPTLVTSERSHEEYNFRKVMHSEKDGKRTNEKIYPNPDPRDKDPMYIGKRIRHDKKRHFESTPLPWKYPEKKKK